MEASTRSIWPPCEGMKSTQGFFTTPSASLTATTFLHLLLSSMSNPAQPCEPRTVPEFSRCGGCGESDICGEPG